MLVAAVITSALVTGLCFALKWKKVHIVAPLQFVATFAVTYMMGPLLVRDQYVGDSLIAALAISAATPVVFLVLRVVVGRLDKRNAGGLLRHREKTE
jgi:hypothetical protein